MTINSKYFDSIRINSTKSDKTQKQMQSCAWAGCEEPGTHKAPAGRDREGEYLYFCLEHVREYNKNFNYFSDLNQKEIAKLQKDALTGNRPTWKSSVNPDGAKAKIAAASFAPIRSGSAAYHNKMRNPYRNSATARAAASAKRPIIRKFKTLETKAFLTLDLPIGASPEEIKAQYKSLIKIHHPDLNNGDRSSEEKFREVLKAYNILKNSGLC